MHSTLISQVSVGWGRAYERALWWRMNRWRYSEDAILHVRLEQTLNLRESYIRTREGYYIIKRLKSLWLIFLLVGAGLACNLSTGVPTPTQSSDVVNQTPSIVPPITVVVRHTPTLIGVPGLQQPTTIPVTSVPALGASCQVYTTYSGVKPENKLSMRESPNSTATQVYRVPNFAEVLLVPNSTEVEAEGYHWLNVMYIDAAGIRYWGWIARDSYAINGVRDPSIATLRSTGRQADC